MCLGTKNQKIIKIDPKMRKIIKICLKMKNYHWMLHGTPWEHFEPKGTQDFWFPKNVSEKERKMERRRKSGLISRPKCLRRLNRTRPPLTVQNFFQKLYFLKNYFETGFVITIFDEIIFPDLIFENHFWIKSNIQQKASKNENPINNPKLPPMELIIPTKS